MDIVKFKNKNNGLIFKARYKSPHYDAFINIPDMEVVIEEDEIVEGQDNQDDPIEELDLEGDQVIEVAGKEDQDKVELDLEAMTVKELNKLAKELGLTGYADLNKPELIIFIESSL